MSVITNKINDAQEPHSMEQCFLFPPAILIGQPRQPIGFTQFAVGGVRAGGHADVDSWSVWLLGAGLGGGAPGGAGFPVGEGGGVQDGASGQGGPARTFPLLRRLLLVH